MRFLSASLALVWIAFAAGLSAAPKRPNVLFILADDMKPALGCYGGEALTPNLDRLATAGVRFDRAYCQYPLCNPSRTSMLLGLYPSTTGILDNNTHFRDTHPGLVTLPQYFRQQGYRTQSFGKIFHNGNDDTPSWSENAPFERKPRAKRTPLEAQEYKRRSDRVIILEGDGEGHTDYKNTDSAIAALASLKASAEPFFLAVGYTQPHSPPTTPGRFFELYPLEKVKLPVDFSPQPKAPSQFPDRSIVPNYDLFIGRDATPDEARRVKAAYLGACSWVDWNIGRLLAALDAQGLRENTIIVFWGDHGYHLGEKGKWSKHNSLFEVGLRVPFIITAPGFSGNGHASARLVETLDFYPTLLDLCGLPPSTQAEGRSLRPLLERPSADWPHPAYAFSVHGDKLSRAVRHEQWLFAEFDGQPGEIMLIDVEKDPAEQTNLARDPAYRATIDKLRALLNRKPAPTGAK